MVLLSFDIEEFDMPFEYGRSLPFSEQIRISADGTRIILGLLKKHSIKATFFCTANFARQEKELIRQIISEGHEVGSHGYYHSTFEVADLLSSKLALEEITGTEVTGYRMARMMPVDEQEIKLAGYCYNSSLNPTWIPGRYNHLTKPRRIFYSNGVIQVPASVTPVMRIPLFWLSFHNFPLPFYKNLCIQTYRKDRYLNIYFHPWEFTDLHSQALGMPGFVKRNSGYKMIQRMDLLITHFKNNRLKFGTIQQFLSSPTARKEV